MKFKVRIVTKAARYGIKIYVLTDAETAFVLKVIVYTGKYTYAETITESTMKTVQVCKSLLEPFAGSFRTVYVDRFYTSIPLLKELDAMGLFVTGTIMKNKIPRELTIPKSSRQFKEMERGDFRRHVYCYKNAEDKLVKYGLVCWKDRDIVYCLTNEADTSASGVCYRRSQGGRIAIERPKVIEEYNRYMGGVDLADKRRLHCNSTIMGQNRWWLKLFFYLLDVGTSNAMILYNEAMKIPLEHTNQRNGDGAVNIVDFKRKLVESFVGSKISRVVSDAPPIHQVIQ